MKHWPIRVRLTLQYFCFFSAAGLLLAIAACFLLKNILITSTQHELDERIDDVCGFLLQQGKSATPEQLRVALRNQYAGQDEGKYLMIQDGSGEWLYYSQRKSLSMTLPPLPALSMSTPSFTVIKGRPLESRVRQTAIATRDYRIAAGLSFRKSNALLGSFVRSLLLLTPVLLGVAALAGHTLSRRALAPVAAISAEARRINERSLATRLPVPQSRDELHDLSETLNQMLERIDFAFRSVRAFTANASHELRTPLTLIRTRVEIALCFPRTAEQYRKTLLEVQATTVHMTALLESLLTLARADANVETLKMAPLSLDRLIEEAMDSWQPVASERALQMTVRYAREPAWVVGDATALRRCIAILVDNACRYTQHGSIALTIQTEGDLNSIVVSDTGAGIAKDDLPHIFERFYRGSNDRGRAAGGAGLGLSLAKWIADQHGAELFAESEPGRGSSFCLRMLSAPAPQEEAVSGPRLISSE